MKKLTLLALITCSIQLQSGLFNLLNPSTDTQGIIVSNEIAEKKQRLKLLKDERDEFATKEKDFNAQLDKEIEKITALTKQKEKEVLENRYTSERKHNTDTINILRDISQLLNETVIVHKSIKSIIEHEIALLEDYLKDPYFSSIKIEPQSYFSYENLYELLQQVLLLEEKLNQAQEKKNNTDSDLESKKRELASIEKELKEKAKEQKKFISTFDTDFKESASQKAEILDLNKEFFRCKKRLLEEKIKELTIQSSLLNTKIFIDQSKLNILKPNLKTVERRLRVYEKDIDNAVQQVNNLKKEASERQINYNQGIQELAEKKGFVEQEIKDIVTKFDISSDTMNAIINWNNQAKEIPAEKEALYYKLGALFDKELEIDLSIELNKTLKESDQNQIINKEIAKNILATWQQITLNKISTNETLNELITTFDNYKKELSRDVLFFKEKINSVTSSINKQVKELNLVKEKIEHLKGREESFNKYYYPQALESLINAEDQINSEIRINGELIKIYSGMISANKDIEKQISLLLNMLEKLSGSVLFRSEYAISSKSLKAILPEFRSFLSDVKNIIKNIPKNKTFSSVSNIIQHPFNNIILIIQLCALIIGLLLLFILLRNALPYISRRLLNMNPPSRILNFIYELAGIIMLFTARHLPTIFIWTTLFGFIWFEFITKIEFVVVFYLISIPYILYILYSFLNFLIAFNEEHNYSIISKYFQQRFYRVFLFLSVATITIFFFKEAFLTATYGKRELPTILDAAYSIILRACIIFLIGREEILSLVPENDEFWLWIRKQIRRLYYPILLIILGIIIVSDPYIGGFGKLVSYILWGIIGTVILIGSLSWLQARIRKISATIFFETEDETSRQERFAYAKTFYGIFTIITFIFFVCLTIYFGAKIWGKTISFESISSILDIKVFSTLGENNQYVPITVGSLLTVVAFILGGILISWIFEHLLLARLFHILLIDIGVQNTISSISSYIIFLIAIVIGLMRIGVSGTTMSYFLGAIAVAIAFAIKGPANDFIGYFILLVERSIKIGDYIELTTSSSNISGIVRKITPRTIVLRRFNSFTVIVPNSTVINSALNNWNYTSTFFAFDDIIVTTSYDSDPAKVKEVLLAVLDKHKDILKSPTPIVRLENFDQAGFVFLVRGFLSSINVLKKWDIASDIRLAIVKGLRDNNIKIAVPVRYVISNPIEKIEQ